MADRNEHAEEFESLVMPLLGLMYRVAVSRTNDSTMAEDLVQTACLKGLQRFGTFRRGTHFRAWILRILQNTWIDELRHRKVVGPTVAVEEQILPDESAEDPGEWADPTEIMEQFADEQVIHALSQLPDDQRLTLCLVDVEQLPHEEVAEIIGVAVGTVKSRTSRARSMLKELLAAHAKELGFTGRRS